MTDAMKILLLSALFFLPAMAAMLHAQSRFDSQDLSMNGFRNPSIGLEYRYDRFSAHAGYYLTNFESGVTTRFVKTGVTVWFLAVDKKEVPSAFYGGASYLRGLTRDYNEKNAMGVELGFRWTVWKGINLRVGGIALLAEGESPKFNPTPGISYSFLLTPPKP
jgi:hypothetical protein